jgi:dTMP kinase
MKRRRGLFIVLEGLDGAGTTTQAGRLSKYLVDKGSRVWLTNEPTDEPVGKLIRDSLSGKIISPRTNQRIGFSERALCLLFAADRLEHSRQIEEARRRATHVICDRYVLSSIAYQSLDASITPRRVVDVNRECAVPDVTILLSVPVEQCLARLKRRKGTPTVYERKKKLEGIDRNYSAARNVYARTFGPLIVIDGSPPAGEVHEQIIARLEPYLNGRHGSRDAHARFSGPPYTKRQPRRR